MLIYLLFLTSTIIDGSAGQSPTIVPVLSECGGTTTALRADITSPGYPASYAPSLSCLWTIDTPADTLVNIYIVAMNIEQGRGNCPFDTLRIASSATPINDAVPMCGTTITGNGSSAAEPWSYMPPINILFTSDSSVGRDGFHLSYEVDSPCKSDPCQNGATCLYTGSNSPYTCLCREGYTGRDCDIDIDECEGVVCQNRGICRDEVNAFLCYCIPGTSGTFCEVLDNPCVFEPCRNGATCAVRNDTYECQCSVGYEGLNCEAETNECLSVPCLNGGTCTDLFNNFRCDCRPGFEGDVCETVLETTPIVRPSTNQPVVILCQDDVTACFNGGTCVLTNGGNGTSCLCPTGFTGATCADASEILDDDVSLYKILAIVAFVLVFFLLVALVITCCYFAKKKRAYKSRIWSANYGQNRHYPSRQTQHTLLDARLSSGKPPLAMKGSIESQKSLRSSDYSPVIDDRMLGSGATVLPVVMANGNADGVRNELGRSSSIPINKTQSRNSEPSNHFVPPSTMPLPRKDLPIPGQVEYPSRNSSMNQLPQYADESSNPNRLHVPTYAPVSAVPVIAPQMYEPMPLRNSYSTSTATHEYYNPAPIDKAHGRPPIHPQLHKEHHLTDGISGNGVIPNGGRHTVATHGHSPKINKIPSKSKSTNRIPNGLAEKLLKQLHKKSPTQGMPSANTIPRKNKSQRNRTKSANQGSRHSNESPSLRSSLRRSEPHLKTPSPTLFTKCGNHDLESRSTPKKQSKKTLESGLKLDDTSARYSSKEAIYKLTPELANGDALFLKTPF